MNDALRRAAPPATSIPPAPTPSSALMHVAASHTAVVEAAALDRTLIWELLVTDGHVRAARLLRLQLWLVALALVLLWLGIMVVHLAPAIQPKTSVAARVQERLTELQARAAAAFTALTRVQPQPDRVDRLPPVDEIPQVVQALLGSLSADDKLPADNVTFTKVDRDAFWSGKWPTEQVSYLKSGGTYLFAAYAHVGPSGSTQAVRWMGAARNFGGKWQYASLGGPGLYTPPGVPSTAPQAIGLSLDPFLPVLPKPDRSKQ
jgi:hypothetical protein